MAGILYSLLYFFGHVLLSCWKQLWWLKTFFYWIQHYSILSAWFSIFWMHWLSSLFCLPIDILDVMLQRFWVQGAFLPWLVAVTAHSAFCVLCWAAWVMSPLGWAETEVEDSCLSYQILRNPISAPADYKGQRSYCRRLLMTADSLRSRGFLLCLWPTGLKAAGTRFSSAGIQPVFGIKRFHPEMLHSLKQ